MTAITDAGRPRPSTYVAEIEAPCFLCESTAGPRERVGSWVWCLFPTPCRLRREALDRRHRSIHSPRQS